MGLVQIFAEDSPSYQAVKKWAAEFKWCKDSTEDDLWSGHPNTLITNELVIIIHRIVWVDRRLIVQQIAKSIGITSGSVHRVLTEILGTSKLSARWVPRMLTPEHKLKRVDISRTTSDSLPGQKTVAITLPRDAASLKSPSKRRLLARR